MICSEMNKDFNIHPKIFLYGLGMAGWSIMFNIISVMIIYFYLPSLDSGLPVLIPQINIFGVFTVFSMVLHPEESLMHLQIL
jgi:hypothetical protein